MIVEDYETKCCFLSLNFKSDVQTRCDVARAWFSCPGLTRPDVTIAPELQPTRSPRRTSAARKTGVRWRAPPEVIDTCRERRLTREHGHSSLAPALLERFCAKDGWTAGQMPGLRRNACVIVWEFDQTDEAKSTSLWGTELTMSHN